jgi:preprotein translocase subunit SecG
MMLQQIILYIHLILAISIIGLVLIQHGKGADAGAAFGSGASGTVFGSAGSGSFLTRLTTALALCFAVTSVALTLLSSKGPKTETLSDKLIKSQDSSLLVPAAKLDNDLPEVKKD